MRLLTQSQNDCPRLRDGPSWGPSLIDLIPTAPKLKEAQKCKQSANPMGFGLFLPYCVPLLGSQSCKATKAQSRSGVAQRHMWHLLEAEARTRTKRKLKGKRRQVHCHHFIPARPELGKNRLGPQSTQESEQSEAALRE